MSYFDQQKTRDIRNGQIRIGTSFKLREDFYSAIWLYLHKVNYILGTVEDRVSETSSDKSIDDRSLSIKDVEPYEVYGQQTAINRSLITSPKDKTPRAETSEEVRSFLKNSS